MGMEPAEVAAVVSAVPATWEEFLAACEKIKAAGYTPITTDDLYAVNVYGYYLAKLKGDDWVFELVNDATKAMWDDPACLEAAGGQGVLRRKRGVEQVPLGPAGDGD